MNHYRRIISSLILLPPLILLLIFASHELFTVFMCVLAFLSLHEYFGLLRIKQASVGAWLSHGLAFALAWAAYLQGLALMAPVLTLGMVLLTATTAWFTEADTPPFLGFLYRLFGVLLIGWGLSHLVLLRSLEHGPLSALLFCTVVWSGDTTAMYVGRYLGRHAMVPRVSLGKTWEGSLGGLASSLTAAALGAWLFSLPMTVYQSLLFGLVVSCGAQLGDLAESLLKRYIGVKDSGNLIPGHGGLLDRLDSFFVATPLAAYFFVSLNALTSR